MKERELKVFLIKRFILMLTLVSFVEFIIITVISNLILPLVMKFLLPELSLIKGLSGADVLVFSLVVVGYVIIAVIDSICDHVHSCAVVISCLQQQRKDHDH